MIRRLLAVSVLAATTVSVTPLLEAPTASAVTCTVTVRLKPGSVGEPVRCLEQRLRELGLATGPVDTVYDSTSVASVKQFQVSRGLYADGLVTSITGRQLGLRGPLPPAGTTKITVLGDSTSAAMRWYDEARNETAIYDVMGTSYDLAWSVESCKRLWATSCYGRLDPGTGFRWTPRSVLPEMQTTLKGRLGNAIVIMAGYDDYPSIADDIDAIVSEAERQGVSRVFWLTYRTTSAYRYGTYYRQHNAALEAAKAKHPNLVVLDWNGYTHSQTLATQDAWFESDGIHMTRAGGMALATYLKNRIDASDVRACTANAIKAGTRAAAAGVPAAPPADVNGFNAMRPQRVFDSRTLAAGKVGAGRFVDVDLSTVVPGATNVALTVTALRPCLRGHLTVWDCSTRPGAATISYEGGRTTTGNAITRLTSGHLCIFAASAVDIAVDLTGWFGVTGDLFHPEPSTRWFDTRTTTGSVVPVAGGSLANLAQRTVPVAGLGPVPAGATAAWLDVTPIAGSAGPGSITVYPGPCTRRPNATTAQVFTGRAAATTVLAGLGADGSVCLASIGNPVHVVLDLQGWFAPDTVAGGLGYVAGAPARVLDTRSGPMPVGGATLTIPATVASVLNVTSVGATAVGPVRARPCDVSATGLLTTARGENVSNLGVVAPSGGACVSTSVPSHFVVDVVGTFVTPNT